MPGISLSAAPAGTTPVQRRNFLNVQIDGIGVGFATSAAPFLPVFLTRLGATNAQVGLLTAMPGMTGLVLAMVIGRVLQGHRQIVPWFSAGRLLVISSYAMTGLVTLILPGDMPSWPCWASGRWPPSLRSSSTSPARW